MTFAHPLPNSTVTPWSNRQMKQTLFATRSNYPGASVGRTEPASRYPPIAEVAPGWSFNSLPTPVGRRCIS